MKKYIGTLGLLALLMTACGGQGRQTTPQKPVFPATEIPLMVSDPQAKADFVTQHYWDKFNFTDTLFLAWPDVLEQAMVDYFVVLPFASGSLPQESLDQLMTRAQADTAMYRFFVEKTEHYLWDPNSPYRNDEFFIPVLENMLASDQIDDAVRARSEYRLELAQKNRIGSTANDFTYTLASGQKGVMSHIRTEFLLLFFNNPGCSTCAQIIAQTESSPVMNRLLEQKRLTILAVYPDRELDEWEAHKSKMPAAWINSYDPEVTLKDNDLYDLKAIPTLYLLDKDKTVLLKDADINQVERFLQQQLQ
ncbi:DUF5106 domain-containing protein [Alistipes sp. OttesenSCG-928-L06]|nr:DUF5106 domain-containing protein [Alistipes sp. OttesenSCG-928-L06]